MKRGEILGTVCAAFAMALVAYLALDSWRISECRDVLRADDFEAAKDVSPEEYPGDLSIMRKRLEFGKTSEEEARCKSKIGLPF